MTDVTDSLAALCAELAALHAALGAGAERAAEPSTAHVLVGATLTPTLPGAGRRTVPGSRPPLDLEALAVQEQIDKVVMRLYADVRAAQVPPWEPGHFGPRWSLRQLEPAVGSLPPDHAQRKRVPAVLDAVAARARRAVDPAGAWLLLGPCPAVAEPRTIATRTGEVLDGGCWTPDRQAIADAALRGETVELWRRSQLSIPRDHPDPLHATIECRSCGWHCTPEDRAPDIVLAAGLDMLVTPGQAAALLAVPPGTVWSWAHRGQIVSLEKGRGRRYSLMAVAQVIVRHRHARAVAV